MADAIEIGGRKFHLGKLPPDPAKRAAMPPFLQAAPEMPESEWKPINRRGEIGTEFFIDQRSHGSCVGFSAVGALMQLRELAGMTFQKLSGAYIYSFINGGRDEGAIISDGLERLKLGTCLEAEAPWDAIYPNRIPNKAHETAKRFRILEAYRVDTWEQAVTALQLGFLLVGAVHVGSRFFDLDGNGVSGHDRGPGNHAVRWDGCGTLPSGEWFIDLANTWGMTFGQQGRTKTTRKHWESVQQDGFAVRAASSDPLDPAKPPEA